MNRQGRGLKMADTNGQEENGIVYENGVDSTSSDEEPAQPSSDVTQEEPQEPQEPTLTDHLNKKLLQSFLTRLDEGSFNFPGSSHLNSSNNETNDFDD